MAEHSTNREAAILLSRVEDIAAQCRSRGTPAFLGFLDTAQRSMAADKLKYAGVHAAFWGGYPDAERVFVGIFPGEEDREAYPFCCLAFRWRQEDTLTHRDFLGSIMALRVKREAVGDICVEPGQAYAFLTAHAARLVLDEVTKIGRVGVTVTQVPVAQFHYEQSFLPVTGTVASLRLDCVVAFLGNLSRGSAAKLIASGLVLVDGLAQTSTDKAISPGEKISIRGVGKFLFDGQDGVSRKDKLRVSFQKYQ